MIERDLAHLRFLHTIVLKGGKLDSSDMDFVLSKYAEISNIKACIEEMCEIIRDIEKCR